MAMETLPKSALLITFEMIYHDDALLGSPEFLHFQLASGLGRQRYDTVALTVRYRTALHIVCLE
jgi:hypothetical protein